MYEHSNIFTYFFAFFGTLFCIWLLMPVSQKIGFVDAPRGHKQHAREIPLIGGISICFGFYFALLSMPISLALYRGLIGASGLLLILGIADDLLDLSAQLRLLVQGFAAIFVVYSDHLNAHLMGNLLFMGSWDIGQYGILLAVFVIVGYLNAFNMLDGQDGLAGCVGFGQILLLTYLLSSNGDHINAHILMLLGTTLIAFLLFNMPLPWRKHAHIFLGNAGSVLLALIIAYFSIYTCQTLSFDIQPITYLWILAYPIFDLITVCVHRIRTGNSPLRASRDHLHHILQSHACSTFTSTLALSLGSFLLGTIGILLNHWIAIEGINLIIYLIALFSYIFFVEKLRKEAP